MAFWPFRRRARDEPTARRSDRLWDSWRNLPLFAGGRTAAGITLTADSPLTHETVLACYQVIAEGCAMLPLYLYRERGRSRKLAADHPLYRLLLNSPCPNLTAFRYWHLVLFEKLHRGNHYSLIVRDGDGAVRSLLPVEPGLCQPFWYHDSDGARRRAYRISAPGTAQAVFLEHEVFHVMGQPILSGPDYGLRGQSIWEMYQEETLGGALATNQFANTSFANGASLSGFIALDQPLDDTVARETRQRIQDTYAGTENASKIGLFGSGAKFYPMSQDAQKAQLLESRKYNRSIIAGLLRVTAHLINDLERGTFSNVEHLDLSHYKHCLRPHLVDLCQTVAKDLLTPAEQQQLYVDHDEAELLRGDLKSRTEFWSQAIQNTIAMPNEARADFNLPPDPDGDVLFANGALVPLSMAVKGPQPPAATPPPAPPTKEPTDGA